MANNAEAATVREVIRLGFEVRVVLENQDHSITWVQLTHDQAKQLNPSGGKRFSIRTRVQNPVVSTTPSSQLEAPR